MKSHADGCLWIAVCDQTKEMFSFVLLLLLLLQAGPVIDAGGLFDYARKQGMIKAATA